MQSRYHSVLPETDKELIERARMGDTEAFGDLIHTHREQARQLAERITRDPHMADDVVQDALIRAFLHLGTLADTNRFLPWLHRIVRNQANMRLRRGGPYKNEQPFTTYHARGTGSSNAVDWDDLDSILYHLTRDASAQASNPEDPEEHLHRKELFETIHALLHCLNHKERGVFEAYFFRQLSPDEIASLYNTTTGSVYTYLHRSKQKLRQTHHRVLLDLHDEEGGNVMTQTKVISLPDWPMHQSVLTTFVDRIGHLLAALGESRPITELMGHSGFAFRMKISNRTTYADGIYVFDWRNTLREFMDLLDYEVTILCGQLSDGPVPLLAAVERFPVVLPIEQSVMPFVRKYIDKGTPILYFDTLAKKPYVHEWSLLYGYDDDNRIVYVTDAMNPEGKVLSYDDLTENPLRFLAGVDGKKKAETTGGTNEKVRQRQAKEAIAFAVNYARRGCGYTPRTVYLSYTSGLAAYDSWAGYLCDGSVTPNRYGMGQLAAVYAEAKSYASQFLRGVRLKGEAMRLVLLGAEAYEAAAESLQAVSDRVPFVRNTEMLPQETLTVCREELLKAKDFETAGIGYLEKAILLWEKGNDE